MTDKERVEKMDHMFALLKEIAGLPVTYIKILDAILFIGLLYITYDVIKKLF